MLYNAVNVKAIYKVIAPISSYHNVLFISTYFCCFQLCSYFFFSGFVQRIEIYRRDSIQLLILLLYRTRKPHQRGSSEFT